MNFDPEFSNFFMNFFNFFVFYRSFHIMVVPIAQEGEFCMQSESSKWRALSTNLSSCSQTSMPSFQLLSDSVINNLLKSCI